jgi:PST family polysaccharide transporter
MIAFRAAQGASWLIFSRFLGRIIDFCTLMILARILSPGDFGMAALAMSLVMIVDTILEIPVVQVLVRLETVTTSHLDTAFTLSAMRGALTTLIILAAAWPFSTFNNDPHLLPLAAVLSAGPLAKGLLSPAMVYFARDLGFRQTFLLEIAGKLGGFAAATFTVLSGGSYWAIVANFVTVSLIATAASYVLAPYRPHISLKRFSDFVGFLGWSSSSQLVAAINWQFDRILIGGFAGKPALGQYAVASDVSALPTQSLIGPALQPMMAAFSLIASNPDRLRKAFLKTARFAMLLAVPACVGISLTADLVTQLLLGEKWAGAVPFLSILALSVIPVPYFQALCSISLALNRPRIIFRLNVIDLAFRILLISIGFYLFTTSGVAGARVALSIIMAVFYLKAARSLLHLPVRAQLMNLWKIAVAAALMSAWVFLLRAELQELNWNALTNLALIATSGAAVYLASLFALGLRLEAGAGRLALSDRWLVAER